MNRYHVEIRGGSSRAEAATKGNTGALPQSPAGLSLVTDKTRQRTTHYTNPRKEGYRNMRYAVVR